MKEAERVIRAGMLHLPRALSKRLEIKEYVSSSSGIFVVVVLVLIENQRTKVEQCMYAYGPFLHNIITHEKCTQKENTAIL